MHLHLKFPPEYQPDIDTIRVNLLKYVGAQEPPFSLKNEQIEKEGEGELKIRFKLEPHIAKTHFLSFYNIPFLSKKKDFHEKQEIISEIFKVHVFVPDIDPEYLKNSQSLISFSDPFTMHLNDENLEKLSHPNHLKRQAQKNLSTLRIRSFPWGLLFLLFFVVFGIIFLKNLFKKIIPKKSSIGVQKKAQESLRGLDIEDTQTLYTQISFVIRSYVESIYPCKAITLTTSEFIKRVEGGNFFEKEVQKKLISLLIEADKVKFTSFYPSREERLKAKTAALHLLDFLISSSS